MRTLAQFGPGSRALLRRLLEKTSFGDECWEWTAGRDPNGYGQFTGYLNIMTKAHIAMYRQLMGPIPEGCDLHHVCRNRRCVRPAHLEPLTRQAHAARHRAERIA